MKKILYKLFVLCAFVVTLTGCELYMDDSDIQLGNPVADGDGYSAPATYMDSITTVTYQFNENTVYINEPYRPHIFSANVDTAAGTIEIRFAKSIPADMLPQRGNCLASSLYDDIFNDNVCHKVDVVEEADGLYVVKGHAVPGREVFKHLVVEGGFYIEGDTTQVGNDSRAGENALIRGIKLRPINHNYTGRSDSIKADGNEDDGFNFKFSLFEIGFNYLGAKGADYLNKNTKIGKSVNNFFSKKTEALKKKADSHKVKLDAEMDGVVGLNESVVFEFNFKFDFDNGSYDFHGIAYNELYVGFAFTEFKGSLVIPIMGDKSIRIKGKKGKTKELQINDHDYIFSHLKIKKPIITSVGIFQSYVSPTIIAEFYATMSFKEPVGFFGKKISPLFEFGKHKDDKTEFSYGEGVHKSIEETPSSNFLKIIEEMESGDVDDGFYSLADLKHDFSIDLGVALTFVVEYGFVYNGFLNLYAQIGPTLDLHYVYDNSHLYDFDVNVPDPETGELKKDITNLNNSYFEFAIRESLTVGGRIDAKIKTFDLFTGKATFDIVRLKYKYKPLNPPVVTFDENRSTLDSAYFTAKITKYWDSEWGDLFNRFALPDKAPYLAIYRILDPTCKWVNLSTHHLQFVCYVKPDESEYDIDDINQTFNYEFKLHNEPIEARNNYVAIPYYDTPFGLKYSYAALFRPNRLFVSGEIKNQEQLTIENGELEDDYQYYGFKFDVETKNHDNGKDHGNHYTMDVHWFLDIEIKDKYSDDHLKDTKDLGYLKPDEVYKYMFFVAGDSPSGYDVTLTLWYYNLSNDHNLKEAIIDVKRLELSPYMGGETIVDLNDVINGYNTNGSFNGYKIMEPK